MHEIGARCAFVAHLRLMHESGPLGLGGCACLASNYKMVKVEMRIKCKYKWRFGPGFCC
jgi:hypothetical protein